MRHLGRGLSHFGHQALLNRVRAYAARDSLWQGLVASDRDVVAIVPLPVLQSLCNRVARSYVQGARLDFDPNVRAHFDQEIRFRVLGRTSGAGHIRGDVRVTHLHGQLSVEGNPALKLLPPDGLQLTAPIRVRHGSGGVVMNADTALARLRTLVRRDVEFRIPPRLFKPFSLPVSLRQQYDGEDFRINARMEDPEVVVRPEYLRFGVQGRAAGAAEVVLFLVEERSTGQLLPAPWAVHRKGVLAVDLPTWVFIAKHGEAEARCLAGFILLDGTEHTRAAIPREPRLPSIAILGNDGGDPSPTARALTDVLDGVVFLRLIPSTNRCVVGKESQRDDLGALVVVDEPLPIPAADREWILPVGILKRYGAHLESPR